MLKSFLLMALNTENLIRDRTQHTNAENSSKSKNETTAEPLTSQLPPNNQAQTNSKCSKFRISSYLAAVRPWSFSASLIPVCLGCALAHKVTGNFDLIIFIVTCLTAFSVHGAGNLVNTYYDFMKGIDSKKRSDDRTLVDKILTPDEVAHLGVMLYAIGCGGFILLVLLSPAKMAVLAFVYFGGLSSSFLYTGGIGLKYIGLGDVLILIIFGPVSVLFAFVAQTGTMDVVPLYYAIPIALNTEAILHSNNTRDMESDQRAGIVTMAILIGRTLSHVLFAFLLFSPYILFAVLSVKYTMWLLLPLITLHSAFKLERHFGQENLEHLPQETAKLNVYFGLFFVLACIMAPTNRLPFLSK